MSSGAYEITSVLKDINDAFYKSENFVILGYFLEYYNNNRYITEFVERTYPPKEEIVALQENMEEEIAETGSSLDEKEEEVTIKRRKNGVSTHAHLLMIVNL